ncbi:hypothetical protein [Burkholderia contaminans]|uniref:hypothetical protein n=1 Tax=Burkholderia contaminans TaxID=488447 RepID=UPI001452FE66|nr:hypothetical protein [Burkholderia contaminans]VWD15441.1 hypothetical protein BCO18442_03504 [Burkholderia contaminans]
MVFKYTLRYLHDSQSDGPSTYESDTPVSVEDVLWLEESGFYHNVNQVLQQKTRVQLLLSKSSQSEAEARLVAAQLKQSK